MELIHPSKLPSLHPVVQRLLSLRGIKTPQEIEQFLSWDLKKLPEFIKLHDLTKASKRLADAIENNELIAIYGDYDVDGTTSCALFYHFFKSINIEVKLFQPSRFVEGYGLHNSSIDLAVQSEVKVLVTVDCGISNVETAEYAKGKLDLIITDHHKDARPSMPDAYAVVNPNRRDEDLNSPLCALAGVGVAFAICLGVKLELEGRGKQVPSLYPLLPLVALGTICDLAPLNPMNLKLCRHGLKQMKDSFPGLVVGLKPEEKLLPIIPSEKLSFYLGPLVNSKGRLDHPEMALNLLISSNIDEARNSLAHLEISNNERKYIQQEVFQEARKEVLRQIKDQEQLCSIVYRPQWHEGVIGIVASKLVETFKVPAIVFTNSEDSNILKASARTAGELNIFDALKSCEDLFIKFGGHKAAAGLSMPKENYNLFCNRMNQYLQGIPAVIRTKSFSYDLEISAIDITPSLIKEIDMLEPFGQGNERPTFLVNDFKLAGYQLMKETHVRWTFSHAKHKQQWQGVSFNYIGKWNTLLPEEVWQRQEEGLKVYTQLGINRFNGREFLQLMVQQVDLN